MRNKLEGRIGAAGTVTPVDELLRRYRPNLVLVSMGDSMAGYAARTTPEDSIVEEPSALADRIPHIGIPCV